MGSGKWEVGSGEVGIGGLGKWGSGEVGDWGIGEVGSFFAVISKR